MNAKRKDEKKDSATERGKSATQKVKNGKDDKGDSATERGKSATQKGKNGKDDKGDSATERGKRATQKGKNGKDDKGDSATERGKSATQKGKNGKDDKGDPTDRRTDSDKKVTLTSLKILIMNAKGPDDQEGTPTERRKNTISNVIDEHKPHITLFQEFAWKKISGKTWKRYPFPDQYVYIHHDEASIMYDNTKVSDQDIPASDLDDILKTLRSSPNNGLKRTFPTDFTPMSRMCIKRIIVGNNPDPKFICISWHGEHTGLNNIKKIEYFKYWMEFLRNIMEKYKLPILAAGDYNVNIKLIEECVKSPFKLCTYTASERRTKRGIVDYCIVTEDLDFSKIKWVDLEKLHKAVKKPNGVLDHDPLVGMLNLTSEVSENAIEAAMGSGN